MARPTMEEVLAHYEKEVGISPHKLFDNPNATTRIYEGIPISKGRFVTIEYENWGIESSGQDSGMSIRVWRNAKLDQMTYLEIRYVLMAFEADFDIEVTYPNGDSNRVYCRTMRTGVRIGTYRVSGFSGKKLDHWSVLIRPEELAYIHSRLKVLKDYIPLPGR